MPATERKEGVTDDGRWPAEAARPDPGVLIAQFLAIVRLVHEPQFQRALRLAELRALRELALRLAAELLDDAGDGWTQIRMITARDLPRLARPCESIFARGLAIPVSATFGRRAGGQQRRCAATW